jgi:hypothetical protein
MFHVKRNGCRYISYEISGYGEYIEANLKRQCLGSRMNEWMYKFLEELLGVDTWWIVLL